MIKIIRVFHLSIFSFVISLGIEIMASNSEENNSLSTTGSMDKAIESNYQSKIISGQNFDSEQSIQIISSGSEKSNAQNESDLNTSTQQISID